MFVLKYKVKVAFLKLSWSWQCILRFGRFYFWP